MLVATTLMLLGLLAGIIGAQLGGYRLGGVIVVPLVTVYFLRSFATFPVFVLSVIAAYVSLTLITRRLLLYGRTLFIISVIIGAVVPVLVFELLVDLVGLQSGLSQVEFVGSVLPGIAAYNYHRIDDDRRVMDMVWSLAVVLFLTVVGLGTVIFVGLTPLATVTPPVLLGSESDIAVAFGLAVDRPTLPIVASDALAVSLITVGTILSEGLRSRYGLRLAGVIVVPLVVLAAFRNQWMLALWVVTAATAYVSLRLLHWWTLLYGRVLLSMSVVFGLLAAISLTPMLPVRHGLLPFFVGLLGGVTAYNLHVVSPAERVANVAVTVSALVGVLAVARLFIIPPPSGLLTDVTAVHVLVGVYLLVPGVVVLYRFERTLPREYTAVPTAETETVGERSDG